MGASFTGAARRWLQTAFAAYLVALGFVVFLPAREAGAVTGFVGVIAGWLTYLGMPFDPAVTVVEFLANIVLFVPFGLCLRLLRPAAVAWRITLTGTAASVLIELVQLVIPGRVTALSDVIANTAGALAGVAAAGLLAFLARQRNRTG
ncbi:teicoplanin resistance protein VanZ [Arthrobacter sp. SW1]|nr:teicoplanin resistance protein VanZ [Arthrobacter sp. SW1]